MAAVNANGDGAASSEAGCHSACALGDWCTGLAGNQFSLFWPIWASNYDAYVTTNLTPPIVWSRVTNQFQSSNGLLYLNFPATNSGAQFFRLSR